MTLKRIVLIVAACLAASALAQALPDPTRPPASLYTPAGAAAPGAAAQALPQLQSVLVAQGRRVAVIDGETYRVGDSYKGKRLASVSDTEVVLVRGKQRQVLRLFPAATAQKQLQTQ